MKHQILAWALLLTAGWAGAQPPLEGLPEPPVIPEAIVDGRAIEPEVTIIKTEQETTYEYRVQGRLYMVRVQPIAGPPYFLMDSNGDGILDLTENDPRNIAIPQWVLFSW